MSQTDDPPAVASPAVPLAFEEAGVCARIREDILAGRLNANDRLKVSDLAARYGVGTNPLREALQQLRGEGLVTIAENRGARVRPINEDYVRDIYELSALVEPYLLRGFVHLCTDADLRHLQDIQSRIEALNFADRLLHAQLDQQFHQTMYERHYNRSTVDLWWRKRMILTAINKNHGIGLRRQRDVIEEHRALIAALRDHDEARACALIVQHVQGSGHHLVDRLRSDKAKVG